jgi:2-furoyl-CoA dehydrogenase large subunit
METPSPFTPLGAKGIGEGNNMSTPVCIANAIADALGPDVDPQKIVLPMTPSRVIELIAPVEKPPANVTRTPPTDGKRFLTSGSVDIAAPLEAVYRVLHDPRALALIIPGCHQLEALGDDHYVADVSLSVGLVRIGFHVEMSIVDEEPMRRIRLSGKGAGALGTAEGDGRVLLSQTKTGTRLEYTYSFALSGKIVAVGARMIESATGIVLKQLFERLGRVATGQTPGAGLWRRIKQLFGTKRR